MTSEALDYCPRVIADLEIKINYRFVGDGSREDRPLSNINADM
jgi:hypothetical protein